MLKITQISGIFSQALVGYLDNRVLLLRQNNPATNRTKTKMDDSTGISTLALA